MNLLLTGNQKEGFENNERSLSESALLGSTGLLQKLGGKLFVQAQTVSGKNRLTSFTGRSPSEPR